MEGLTIQEAAETTGWSARMLRYIEDAGLVEVGRTASGYRVYGPGELQRLRTLRELLAEHEIGLSDLAFALRLRNDDALRNATDDWLEAEAERPDEDRASDPVHGPGQREHEPAPNALTHRLEDHGGETAEHQGCDEGEEGRVRGARALLEEKRGQPRSDEGADRESAEREGADDEALQISPDPEEQDKSDDDPVESSHFPI